MCGDRFLSGDIWRVGSLKEAFENTKQHPDIWKISFTLDNNETQFRFVRVENEKNLWVCINLFVMLFFLIIFKKGKQAHQNNF